MNHIRTMYALVLGGALLVVSGILAWYFYANSTSFSTSSKSATTTIIDLTAGPTTTDAYSVEIVPISSQENPPSLERSIPETPALSVEARAALLAQMKSTIAALKMNPQALDEWNLLGTQRKILTDYEGALEAWRYVAAHAPSSPTAFANMGNIYATVFKDYAQAEMYYKKAIALEPQNPGHYVNLYEIYHYWYKQNSTAVEELLKQAIKNNPNAVDVRVLLARYYGEKGMIADAKAAYDLAISAAGANTTLVATLKEERKSLDE